MTSASTSSLRVWLFRPSQAVERAAMAGRTNVPGLGNLPLHSTTPNREKTLTRDQEKAWANLLMRSSLSRTCEGLVPPEAFVFARQHKGKPVVDWEPTLWRAGLPTNSALPGRVAFNMTHTEGMMACATLYHAQKRPEGSELTIGIDLESIQRKPRKGVEKLARRRLAGPEAEWILGCASEKERERRFLELWTLKEAYLKATGDGLSSGLGLKNFCIRFEDDRTETGSRRMLAHVTSSATGSRSPKYPRGMSIQWEAIPGNDENNGVTALQTKNEGIDKYKGDASAEGWRSFLLEVEQTHLLALCYNLQWRKGTQEGTQPVEGHPPNCSLDLLSTIPLLGPDKRVDSRILAAMF